MVLISMADNDGHHVAELCEGVNSIALFHDKTLYGETSAGAPVNIRKRGKSQGTKSAHSAGFKQKKGPHSSANTRRKTTKIVEVSPSNEGYKRYTYHERQIPRNEIHIQREIKKILLFVLQDLENPDISEEQRKQGTRIHDQLVWISKNSLYRYRANPLTVKSIEAEIPEWMTNAKKAASEMEEYDEDTFRWRNDHFQMWENWYQINQSEKRHGVRFGRKK